MVLLTYLVPTEVFFKRHAVKGRALIPALNSLALGQNEPVMEIIGEGLVDIASEVDFNPDWTTFKYMPWAPGHAMVMGNTFVKGWF